MDDLDKSSGRSAKGINAFAKGSAIAGGLLVGAFALAVKTSADFEKQISAVGAVSGATSQEMDKIRETALRIGKDTKFSASEAAIAMEELAKAGVSTTDILGGAADATVALAAAGGVDLPVAATIASNAMNAFGLSAKELPRVADLIAGAANASAIDVGEFGQSLQQAGAVAHTVGVPFSDLTVAIAALGNAGIKGSDAGTSLKTMLQNLNPSTKKQADLMKKLGIITADGSNKFFDAKGNIKSLADVSQVLQDSLSGMTKQQKLATLETLFGSDAIRAAAVLAEGGAKGFNNLAANIEKVKAADVAAKRMDNLAGSIEQFKGSLETALITAGAPFQAGIRQIVDALTGLVNGFTNLSPAVQKLIGQFFAFGGAALLLTAGILKIVGFFMSMGPAAKVVASGLKLAAGAARAFSLALFANPIGLIIAAIIALGVALFILYKKNAAVRAFIDAAWQGIQRVIDTVVSWITGTALPAIGAALGAIGRFFVGAKDDAVGAWQGVTGFFSSVFSFIGALPGRVAGFFVAAWNRIQAVWTAAPAFFGRVVAAIGTFLSQLPAKIAFIIGFIIGRWIQFQVRMVQIAIQLGMKVLTAVVTFIGQLPGRIAGFLAAVISRAVSWSARMISTARSAGSKFLQGVVSFIQQLPGRVGNLIASTLTRVVSWASRMASSARSAGSRFIQGVVSFLSQLPGRVASFLSSALSRVVSWAGQMRSRAAAMASGVVSAVASGLAALPGIVSGAVGRAISAFQGMIGRAFSAARSLASSLWNGFKAGLFGSPKTLIEYALINMNEATARELHAFERQSADIKKVSESLAEDTTAALSQLGSGNVSLTGNVAVAGRSSTVDELKKQSDAMVRLASAVPRGETAVRVTAQAPAAPSNVINVDFTINGVRDANEVRAVVTSSRVLRPLAQAARARGGGGSF
jgi:TP901 family phage tail tape measure protein